MLNQDNLIIKVSAYRFLILWAAIGGCWLVASRWLGAPTALVGFLLTAGLFAMAYYNFCLGAVLPILSTIDKEKTEKLEKSNLAIALAFANPNFLTLVYCGVKNTADRHSMEIIRNFKVAHIVAILSVAIVLASPLLINE